MSSKNVVEITFDDFDRVVLRSDVPVVVDFWAPWCGPCVAFGPVFERLASKFAGKAKFVKFNVDTDPDTAKAHQVRSVPTVMLFKNGREVYRTVGLSNDVEVMLARHLG